MDSFLRSRDEEAASSSSAAASGSSGNGNGSVITETEFFIFHKVSKLDTLAGIAIKYNVQVGEIKLANGLHSDMSLFARDHIKIPKKKLPPSMYYKPESKGSNGGGNRVGSSSLPHTGANMSVAMTQLKSYYGLGSLKLSDDGGGAGEAERGRGAEGGSAERPRASSSTAALGTGDPGSASQFKPSLSHSGIVETIIKKQEENRLIQGEEHVMRNGKNAKKLVVEEKGSNGAMVSDALIRKRNMADEAMAPPASAKGSRGGKLKPPQGSKSGASPTKLVIRPPLFDSKSKPDGRAKATAAATAMTPTQKKETFFEKIKKVANKPALQSGPPRSSSNIKLIDLGEATLDPNTLRSAKSDGASILGKTKLRGKAD